MTQHGYADTTNPGYYFLSKMGVELKRMNSSKLKKVGKVIQPGGKYL